MKPILFSTPMVKAILDGRKSQTRRVVKPQMQYKDREQLLRNARPQYRKGDVLWVRETWFVGACADRLKPSETSSRFWLQDNGGLWYAADDSGPENPISSKGRIRQSIFMPAWASRIFLTVEEVRVERLQDISDDDAITEGIEIVGGDFSCTPYRNYLKGKPGEMSLHCSSPVRSFQTLWDSINGKPKPNKPDVSWKANPLVWVTSFKIKEKICQEKDLQ